MSLSEQELSQLAALVDAQKTFQATVCQMMQTWNAENKDGQKRIHERLDQILSVQSVPSETCEQRRNNCKACINAKIQKVADDSDTAIKETKKEIENKQDRQTVKKQMDLGNWIQTAILLVAVIAIYVKVGV